MTIFKTSAAIAFAALAAGAALLPATAMAQANCQWYATTALKQQQENEKLKCGFKGDAWSADMKAHLGWCSSVAPDVWKAAAQKRDQELQTCAGGKK